MKPNMRIELPRAEAERLGLVSYYYEMKYRINGAKFKRKYRTREAADARACVLAANGITSVIKRVQAAKVTS